MKSSSPRLHYTPVDWQNQQTKASIFRAIKRGFQLFIQHFTSGNELRVWTTIDHSGKITWHAYDPVSDRRVLRHSEDEMRTWIEQRYYN
jgi:hypothetical protein